MFPGTGHPLHLKNWLTFPLGFEITDDYLTQSNQLTLTPAPHDDLGLVSVSWFGAQGSGLYKGLGFRV